MPKSFDNLIDIQTHIETFLNKESQILHKISSLQKSILAIEDNRAKKKGIQLLQELKSKLNCMVQEGKSSSSQKLWESHFMNELLTRIGDNLWQQIEKQRKAGPNTKKQTPKKLKQPQNKPGNKKSAQKTLKKAKKSHLASKVCKQNKEIHKKVSLFSSSQEETLVLEDIESESISKFTPRKLSPSAQPFANFEETFKLKTHKSNIFKTPEKDDYILVGSENVSPTAPFLQVNENLKSQDDQNIEFTRRTNEVFKQEKFKNQEGGKILIRLDFGRRDLISSLFGYETQIEKYKLVKGKLLTFKV